MAFTAQSNASSDSLSGTITPFRDDFEEVTLKLSPGTIEFVKQAATKRGMSPADIVRIALGTAQFLAETVDSGGKLQIREKNKTYDVSF